MIIEQSELRDAVGRCRRIIRTGYYDKLYSCIRMSWSQNELIVKSLWEGQEVRTTVPCITTGTGDIALEPSKLHELVGTLRSGPVKIEIDQPKFKIKIIQGTSKLSLQGLDPVEWIDWNPLVGAGSRVEWSHIAYVINNMSKILTRRDDTPIFNSLYIKIDTSCGESVATDSNRLGIYKFPVDGQTNQELLIPVSMIKTIKSVFEMEEIVEIVSDNKFVMISTDKTSIKLVKLSTKYVNYSPFVEQTKVTRVIANTDELRRILQQAMIYSKRSEEELGEPCLIKIDNNRITVEVSNMMDSHIDVDHTGNPFDIRIMPYMTYEAIQPVRSEQVELWAGDKYPALAIEGDGLTYISMGLAK